MADNHSDQVQSELPHPFFTPETGFHAYSYHGFGEHPTTLAELRMIRLSWSIRGKSDWHIKAKNKSILQRWRNEALEQQELLPPEEKLSQRMVDYVLGELEGYASLIDTKTGIQHGCNDALFFSHHSVPDDLAVRLRTCVAQLEAIPESQKDWHPGSDGLVLGLVHPSLYCLVYDVTLARSGAASDTTALSLTPIPPPPEFEDEQFFSPDFSWLPSDFRVAEDGSIRLVSPYINNIHPSNTALITTLEEILATFVPMWERVLGSIQDMPFETNRGYEKDWKPACPSSRIDCWTPGAIPCIWSKRDRPDFPNDPAYDREGEKNGYASWPGETEAERTMAFMRTQNMILPEAPPEYTGALERNFKTFSLRDRTLQIIVKLASIHLTPEKSNYPGGSWHVEGMLNEHIVSTGIYYYDSENTTDSTLAFRVSTSEPAYHQQNDSICSSILWGMDRGSQLVQERGSINTRQGVSLAFPNIYQHRVSPFSLADPAKPGHRKILAFFLVDPTQRIHSATDAPPQQDAWIREAVYTSLSGRLPAEIQLMIAENLEGTMTLQEAEEYRDELIAERSAFVGEYKETVMQTKFNMCEH